MSNEQSNIEKPKAGGVIVDEYTTLARQIPDEWGSTPKEKKSLIKSVHVGILGKDREGNLRPINDLVYFVFQCAQRNLNPFKAQIHGVYIWDSTIKAEKLVVINGIGGFRAIAQRSKSPLYAGSSEAEFDYKIDENDPYPASAKVDVFAYNPVTGVREIVATGRAFWEEYAKYTDEYEDILDANGKKQWDPARNRYKSKKVGRKLNSVWASRPRGQLAKCAEAQALRQAFPEELSGIYVQQEVDRLMLAPGDLTVEKDEVKRKIKIAEKDFVNDKDKVE